MNIKFDQIEKYRITGGNYGTNSGDSFGAFYIPYKSFILKVLATDGEGFDPRWEHVSVSLPNRCPNWEEMSFIKNLFWNEDETVVQIHPPKDQYINQHPYCLHLWKKFDFIQPLPPMAYVGLVKNQI